MQAKICQAQPRSTLSCPCPHPTRILTLTLPIFPPPTGYCKNKTKLYTKCGTSQSTQSSPTRIDWAHFLCLSIVLVSGGNSLSLPSMHMTTASFSQIHFLLQRKEAASLETTFPSFVCSKVWPCASSHQQNTSGRDVGNFGIFHFLRKLLTLGFLFCPFSQVETGIYW